MLNVESAETTVSVADADGSGVPDPATDVDHARDTGAEPDGVTDTHGDAKLEREPLVRIEGDADDVCGAVCFTHRASESIRSSSRR